MKEMSVQAQLNSKDKTEDEIENKIGDKIEDKTGDKIGDELVLGLESYIELDRYRVKAG